MVNNALASLPTYHYGSLASPMLYIRQLFTSFRFCLVDSNSNVEQNVSLSGADAWHFLVPQRSLNYHFAWEGRTSWCNIHIDEGPHFIHDISSRRARYQDPVERLCFERNRCSSSLFVLFVILYDYGVKCRYGIIFVVLCLLSVFWCIATCLEMADTIFNVQVHTYAYSRLRF